MKRDPQRDFCAKSGRSQVKAEGGRCPVAHRETLSAGCEVPQKLTVRQCKKVQEKDWALRVLTPSVH